MLFLGEGRKNYFDLRISGNVGEIDTLLFDLFLKDREKL